MDVRFKEVGSLILYVGVPVLLFTGVYMANERGKLKLRRNVCQSNLKQVALGMMQYRLDYSGRFPPIVLSPAPVRLPNTGVNGPAYGWADAIMPYTKSISILNCVSNSSNPFTSFYPEQPGYTDYWLNSYIAGRNLSQSNVIMMGDGSGPATARYTMSGLPADWENAPEEQTSLPNVPQEKTLSATPTTQPPWFRRHLDGANYSFIDGHVKWLTPEQLGAPNFHFKP